MSVLDQFLSGITQSLRGKNGYRIAELIHLDVESLPPNRQQPYVQLNQQLKSQYPAGQDGRLLERCKAAVPQDEFGSFSMSFSESIARYFRYLRGVDTADNLSKALEIRQLTSQCVTALGDTKYGVIMIPIVLSFSRTLASIASYLDRNPSILKRQSNTALPATDDSSITTGGGKVSFLEDTANVLRDAFIKCLQGSAGVQRTTRPSSDDKRIGIYLTANATLKLLFQARKLRNAQQMFLSIDAQSPPLSFYPAAQRVTYLYYLGRYHFANNHFLRAATVLGEAYDGCHARAQKHRRLILTYLIASNMCLGNFPTSKLLLRPDANPLGKKFLPLIKLIKSGDIGGFASYLSLSSSTSAWFLRRRILLQLRNRCEVLLWRSLIRKCFILVGYKGEEKKIPFLHLHRVRHAARFSIARARSLAATTGIHSDDGDDYVDPEFRGIQTAEAETGFSIASGTYSSSSSNATNGSRGSQVDHFPSHSQLPEDQQSPTIAETEAIFMSLIQQGFLKGFISRPATSTTGTTTIGPGPRFAIPGSKAEGGPINKGFPSIYATITSSNADEGAVPGRVRVEDVRGGGGGHSRATSGLGGGGGGGGGSMAGRVVNLSGARPVGAQ